MSSKHILSFSGGKDSTFLLLELIRRKYPHPEYSFDYLMFEKLVKKRNGKTQKGYSWCGGRCRWGTTEKLKALDQYAEQNKNSIIYIGIAADETARLEKERAEYKRFPLAEWGVTESECLQGCYNAGFFWGGMYELLDRLSCKFCTNKNLKELRNIRKHYPNVWDELKQRQQQTARPFKNREGSIFELEKRFEFEDERTEQGLSITNREFFQELKQRKENNNHVG